MNAGKRTHNGLNAKQRATVRIAAFTATGDLVKLADALTQELDAGITINECKEMLVQLYAYCGFPRSLNAIGTLMKVLDGRKAEGIMDIPGSEASLIPTTAAKYEQGKAVLEKLTQRPESGPKTGIAAFCPVFDVFLKEHLFGDIFERDVLSYSERELVTVAALMSMKGVEPQLQAHLGMAINAGISQPELDEILENLEEIN